MDELVRAVGRLEGKVDSVQDSVKKNGLKIDALDGRLQNVERKTAIGASVISAAVSTGVALIAAKMRSFTG